MTPNTYTPEQWAIIMQAHDDRERIANERPAWLVRVNTARPHTFRDRDSS
jgi:hypothetical protein